ncbi:MAG: sigma-54-dependent Fis family transcriptional regulator [Deltaproteobacteria bacterium]|nr:sigma-54-dependent Fis family transcriptional regulator [Deltaproteobacteria bacterium]MBW1848388.1 sigma-54-dependent Fis family transcriptional regulator [Deltaproteobacteria bacterium]MBW1983537.1 sigma-54-dependent Fis family transcriptional regulator [Deltaproteobacteria bacterium]MBW2180021.1 sigma-54-dependent Fis family transcriptional regulator [Deltaproteobacteria bacterium]
MSELILLIDDDENLRKVTEYNLNSAGYKVISAGSGKEGVETFLDVSPKLVITDVKLGDMNGIELLGIIKEKSPDTPIIVITAFGTIEMAVEAMRHGAFNFITKPFDRDTLRLSCKKALELKTLRSQKRLLSDEVNRLTGTEGMETANSAMRDLLSKARKVANSEATVLITGESGTGKEVLARLIHQHSPRENGPMVAVNCASIPATLIESELFGHVKGAFTGAVSNRIGRFQSAGGGTLFLDEIGELKIDLQVKLLRVIQEREIEPVGSEGREKIDIRIIAATNKDLQEAVAKGEFREDLYYRLSVIPLYIPPLRERKEDIPALVKHFMKKYDALPNTRFSKKALDKMKAYSWPGNIRELQNTVERCIILANEDVIDETDLQLTPYTITDETVEMEIPDEGLSLHDVEKSLIKKALKKSNGNQTKAAALLKIPRHVIIYRMEKYNI